MLNIYIDGLTEETDMKIVNDVELWFSKVKLQGTEAEAKILKEIEQAEYLDPYHIRIGSVQN